MTTVFTIGHSNHPIERFVSLLRAHKVTAIADVRSAPYSRLNPQFNRDVLKKSLKKLGVAYVFLGKELGGRPEDPACYENGRVQYGKLAETKSFKDGLQRVFRGARRYRIALLCAEKEPLVCHRTLLVARALDAQGVSVSHIHADGKLESHHDAMTRLVRLVGMSDTDLFRPREDLVAEACALQERRIAYTDDEIREKASA